MTPINLVPACKDCNTTKLASLPKSAGDVTLHPYFDDIEKEQWLSAIVRRSSPIALSFSVQAPAIWDALLTKRVENHFFQLKLAALYASHAAEEVVNQRFVLDRIYAAKGAAGVQAQLLEQAETYAAANINSWQAAAYKAMASDDWFCEGGFAQ